MLTMTDDRPLLDITTVAEKLNISGSTIRGLVRSGKLRAYRIGGKRGQLRFKDEDLRAYIESSLVQPAEHNDS
jgi:excisionase family DNA binding protein